MGYFIALDAGGTKTETLLLDESGRILLRDISLGCNAMDMGLEEALRRAVSTLRRVAQHIPGGKPDYAFCGIASMNYYGEAMRGPLRAAFADWPLYLEDDGWGMISSMLGQAPGCCIVCGTGCSLFARTPDVLYHIGGLGYLIDTVGSGFILGRDAILAAIKQVEGFCTIWCARRWAAYRRRAIFPPFTAAGDPTSPPLRTACSRGAGREIASAARSLSAAARRCRS